MSKAKAMPESGAQPPKRRHRVFPWIFLAIQIGFLIWVIGAITDRGSCEPGYQDACDAGTAIGVGLIIVLWVAVDIILGFTYLVFRMFRR
ncbi:hypothetical protein [Actinomadura madurae]|uniref:hypothetical protein n=1 Tax=Actinomadura madurae TaxID=1993 RepID=UPI002026E016|nr:hypothetical protein [Actinomadura madurae]MCP9949384.1 hypothetical protein [Actinomadura madurae]MCP9966138.1 hypothetical protein [Actinomadura madurae]MCP9978629.1 hypothetical protein [Actinomadura madurae]MCQ0009850.1 hypothetical protein [Actinomadura madurae]MCQ0014824.1 hypothetical protein [Actinomadura madurae]